MSRFGASKIVLVVIAIFSLVVIITQRWQGREDDSWKDIVSRDGLGYYEYLPSLFIDNDLGQQNDSLAEAMLASRILIQKDENVLIKYTVGTAVLQAPFFAIGHLWAAISGEERDGYSAPYQKMISLAALFYLLLGLWSLRGLLRSFETSDSIIAITILVVFFGTDLLYYSLMQPAMSHVYSFCMITGSFLFIRRTAIEKDGKYLIFSAVLFSLVLLIRPVNFFAVLATPFLMPSPYWSEWFKIKLSLKRSALIAGVLAILLLLLQPVLWSIQTGSFFTWPYSGEGFYWGSPKLFAFLVSIRKGLFFYTPVLLFAFVGLWYMFKRDAERALNFCIYLAVIFYISSAWWNWYYGDSFGQRVMIDHFAVFALLIAFGLKELRVKWIKISVGIAGVLFIVLNLLQSWQYEHFIMDRYNMNMAKYKYIFLKTGEKSEGELGGAHDIRPYSSGEPQLIVRARTNIETMDRPFFGGKMLEDAELAFSGKVVNELSAEERFSTTFSYFAHDSLLDANRMYLVVELKRLQPEPLGSEYAIGAVSISSPDDESWHYVGFRMNDVPPQDHGTWEQMRYAFDLPAFKTANDELKFYIWNKEGQHFYIDDIMVSLHLIK